MALSFVMALLAIGVSAAPRSGNVGTPAALPFDKANASIFTSRTRHPRRTATRTAPEPGCARGCHVAKLRACNALEPPVLHVTTPLPADPDAPIRMLVGTFHKTGTILMRTIMRRVSAACGLTFWAPGPAPLPANWNVLFHVNSNFPRDIVEKRYPTAIVVRDPRDVVISAAHYHCTQATPGDAWLHVPDPKLGGETYGQRISALPTDDDRYIFEMQNKSADTISRMLRFPRKLPNVLVMRFEDLVVDSELTAYRRMFTWLGLPQDCMSKALDIARANSIFAGGGRTTHVRSGRPEEWRTKFSPRVLAAFNESFPGVAEELGYPAS